MNAESDVVNESEQETPVDLAETVENTEEPIEAEEAATSDDAEGEEKPKRRSRAEERINALTREKYEAQKRAEAYERQLAEMQMYIQQAQNQPKGDEMPKLSDYNYDEAAYSQAVQAWNQSQIQRYQEHQARQAQQYQQYQQAQQERQAIESVLRAGQEKYPDFIQKVNDPNLPPLREINPAAFEAVKSSDAAIDVAYYLASNPQEVYQFASLSPVQAIRKVAQIEAQLNNKPASVKMPPKPPSRLSGHSEAVKDPEKMSMDEWLKWRNGQLSSR